MNEQKLLYEGQLYTQMPRRNGRIHSAPPLTKKETFQLYMDGLGELAVIIALRLLQVLSLAISFTCFAYALGLLGHK